MRGARRAGLLLMLGAAALAGKGIDAMETPAELVVARRFECGSMRVEIAHTPVTDRAHIDGTAEGDPFRDRIEITLTDPSAAHGAAVAYQSPQPLQFFFSVLRRLEDGALVDLTDPQIDAHHTGAPEPQTRAFEGLERRIVDRVSYFALPTIAPLGAFVPGDYVLRLKGWEIARTRDGACRMEPIDLPLTLLPDPPPER